MQYIALLRGINVGGNHKVEMKKLRELFESLGYTNIQTYINSGNIIFESSKRAALLYQTIPLELQKYFGFDIPTLLKTSTEIKDIAQAIPKSWQNNAEQKTDIAYLFKEIDYPEIVTDLPIKKEFMEIIYTPGALIWHVSRKNYNKSHLNKIISNRIYKDMTVRNVNTARVLAKY